MWNKACWTIVVLLAGCSSPSSIRHSAKWDVRTEAEESSPVSLDSDVSSKEPGQVPSSLNQRSSTSQASPSASYEKKGSASTGTSSIQKPNSPESLARSSSPEGTSVFQSQSDQAHSPVDSPVQLPIHLIDEPMPEAIQSPYTTRLVKLMKSWPSGDLPKSLPAHNPVWTKWIRTPGNPTYIGSKKVILIQAPLQTVSALMEDFEAYPRVYDGLKSVRILKREGNKVTTSWERYSPAFFVPNIRYEQIYLIDHPSENRAIYRYQLKTANSVNHADGFIFLDAEGSSTRLTSIDFFDASWGLLGSLAVGKIWHETVENDYRGSIAFKTKAEHPDWTLELLKKEAERMLSLNPVEPIHFADSFDSDSQ